MSDVIFKEGEVNWRAVAGIVCICLFTLSLLNDFFPNLLLPFFEVNTEQPMRYLAWIANNTALLLFALFLLEWKPTVFRPGNVLKVFGSLITMVFVVVPFNEQLGGVGLFFDWSFASLVIWGTTFMVMYLFMWNKTKSSASLFIAAFLVGFASHIYELPLNRWGRYDMFLYQTEQPFFFHIRFAALVFAIYVYFVTFKFSWKRVSLMGLTLVGYVMWVAVFWTSLLNGFGYFIPFPTWTYRLPTALFMLLLVGVMFRGNIFLLDRNERKTACS